MKRIVCALLLAACLLAGSVQPIFAAPGQAEPAAEPSEETLAAPSEPLTESTGARFSEPSEETLPAQPEENVPDAEPPATRAGTPMKVSDEGIAFINELMGGSYGGTNQLANAEYTVNDFISRHGLSLDQQQFDALADFVMAYGSYVLTSGYRVETVISGGNYSDTELADAFCAWVTDSGTFSQRKLDRRLREIKLFLYGSYSGNCSATFRYVVYFPNGGSLGDNNTVVCYTLGSVYDSLPVITRSGYSFGGWYTAASGGEHLCNTDLVTGNQKVYAHWSTTPVEDPNGPSATDPGDEPLIPPELKMTETGVQFIKDNEGFAKYPVWDYAQYSVGYGSRCPDDKLEEYRQNGITEEEADYLLRVMLADFEKVVDGVLAKSGGTFTQAQYDALVSFTYNLGQQWIGENNTIYRYVLYGGYDEMQLVNAFGNWCHAGGAALPGLQRRRMDEANIYLNGDYTVGSRRYLCLNFNAAQGTLASGEDCHYYKVGEAIDFLPTPSRQGYDFLGWYEKPVGGGLYSAGMTAPNYGVYTLYAHWEENDDPIDSSTGSETTDPTEPPEPPEPPEPEFPDVSEGAWYYDAVLRAAKAGLLRGMDGGNFEPQTKMSRAMLVTVLWRYAGEKTGYDNPFADVSAGRYYTDAVAWASAEGIVGGVGDGKFDPDGNVTREQIVTILYRYIGEPETEGSYLDFPDYANVGKFAEDAMRWAVAEGVIGGSNGNLFPKGYATRAEVATIFVRFTDMA